MTEDCGSTIRIQLNAIKQAEKGAGKGESAGLLFLEALAAEGYDFRLIPIKPVPLTGLSIGMPDNAEG